MKKQFTLLFLFFLIANFTFAQKGFNYKAVIYDNGTALENQEVEIRFTILEDGTDVYQESHVSTTDSNGIITILLGEGTAENGDFEIIDWSKSLFLKVEVDNGTGFTEMSTTEFKFVPQAKYAEKAGNVPTSISALINDTGYLTVETDGDSTNELQTLSVSGNELTISNGNVVTLPTGSGGDQWGSQNVVSDATLSGEGTSSSPLQVVGNLTDDQNLLLSGADLTIADGNTVTFTGWDTDASDDFDGDFNSLSNVPADLTDGDDDTQLTEAEVDAFVSNNGYLEVEADGDATNELQTLSLSGNDLSISGKNTVTLPASGAQRLNELSDAHTNNSGTTIYIGTEAGTGTSAIPDYSTAVGYRALYNSGYSSTATNNVAVGSTALKDLGDGSQNTAIGAEALASNQNGLGNVAIGYKAGDGNNGSGNVFIGSNTTTGYATDNKLIIDNSNTSTPLINGDFGTDELEINGSLVVNKTTGDYTEITLETNGTATGGASNIRHYSSAASGNYTGTTIPTSELTLIKAESNILMEPGIGGKVNIKASTKIFSSLEVGADISVAGRIQTVEAGNSDLKAYAYGEWYNGAQRVCTSNVTITQDPSVIGKFKIVVFPSATSSASYIVSANLYNNIGFLKVSKALSDNHFYVYTYNTTGTSSALNFTFVVYKQ
ncbi:MAG: hypothetical protein L3J54_06225 [Draconibacterium sp.]|nr:hypothetical protein [Draconibacterium sp.]